MDYSPSRRNNFHKNPGLNNTQQPKMSILTMPAPSPYPAFRNDLPWNATRPPPDSSRPRMESKHVSLPSIRQTFPDLHLESSLADVAPNLQSAHKAHPPMAGTLASPEYVHAPNANKKRRISNEDEQESLRAKQVPRLYRSPEAPLTRHISPSLDHSATTDAQDYWARSPSRNNSYAPQVAVSAHVSVNSRVESRQALPSLPPSLSFEREAPSTHRPLETTTESTSVPRPTVASTVTPTMDRSPYQSQDYGYAYHHPSRFQSLSTSSVRSYDRAPFSAGAAYGSNYSDMARYSDIGSMSIGGDAKQRKRRGNLPKETTDKLRSWFVAHLQHPYPTEDEKQDLMRQTGLQMNQISNWFINARRRQLPTMINNARAESDAMNGRSSAGGSDNTVLTSTEQSSDYGGKREDCIPLSDGEGGGYEDDMSDPHLGRLAGQNRLSV